jgi:hypothetical protein
MLPVDEFSCPQLKPMLRVFASILFAAAVPPSSAETPVPRSVVIGGESLHEEKAPEFLLDIARNLRSRPGLKAKALYSSKLLAKEEAAAVQKIQTDGATIVNDTVVTPWLSRNGLAGIAPGEALAWVAVSLYGTAIELVAFVRGEDGQLLGICHRQASTRSIPGEGGRFDRVAPGPRQYLQNATVELAADIAEVLRRNRPIPQAIPLPVILPDNMTEKNRAWALSYLALFARFCVEWEGLRPCLPEKTGAAEGVSAATHRLQIEVSGGGEDAPEEVTLTVHSYRPDGSRVVSHSEKAPRDDRLWLARATASQVFGEGDRILVVTPPPPEEEKPRARRAPAKKGPHPNALEDPPPCPIRVAGDCLVYGADPKATPKWSHALQDSVSSNLATRGDLVAFGCRNGDVALLKAGNGEPVFRTELRDSVCVVHITDAGGILAGDIGGNLNLLGQDGRSRWDRHEMAAATHGTDLRESVLGIALGDGTILALGTADGKEAWRCHLPERIGQSPLVYDDSLIVAGVSGRIYRVGLADGKSQRVVMLPLPAADPLHIVRKAKLPSAAFRDKPTDVLNVRCADGSTVLMSLSDARRPTDIMDLGQDWDTLDEETPAPGQ